MGPHKRFDGREIATAISPPYQRAAVHLPDFAKAGYATRKLPSMLLCEQFELWIGAGSYERSATYDNVDIVGARRRSLVSIFGSTRC